MLLPVPQGKARKSLRWDFEGMRWDIAEVRWDFGENRWDSIFVLSSVGAVRRHKEAQ